MQLFEDVLCRTALPQSNLHASSPSKPTTASFISTNLTIHTNPVQHIRRVRVAKHSEPHYPRSSSHRDRSPTSFVKRANSKNTAASRPVRTRSFTSFVSFAHELQWLQVTFWCTSSLCGHGKPTFRSFFPLSGGEKLSGVMNRE